MNNIKDLNIQKEILPLFDFTFNDFTKDALYQLLQLPLPSVTDIEKRQEIIKGFILNSEVFNHYSYSRVDFYEVHNFLNDPSVQNYEKERKLKFLFSEKEKNQTKAKFIQLLVLFHKLNIFYIKRIKIGDFPESYQKEIIAINDFLSSFNLNFYNNLIRENQFKIKHILELTRVVSDHQQKGRVDIFYKQLLMFETYLSISIGIAKHQFCFPTFSIEHLSFENIYHPLLNNPVKNSFTNYNNVVLITGPNMSGKSTLLKSIGLCIYLAHLGLATPVSKMVCPFFDYISIAINHDDDILKGYSHFMNEIMRLKKVLIKANENKSCFAVFDELFRGTNIEDAIQISTTTINGLSKLKNSFFFISTHLHQLKEIEQVKTKQVDSYYVECIIQNNTPIFSYRIKEGWSDLKVGQLLFEKEGLNELLNSKKIK
jgi:DNA mismatch repair protein MutS